MLRVVIVEDELHSREALKTLLTEYCPGVIILGTAASVDEGIKQIRSLRPELVFLDIEIKSETGFDLLSKVKNLNFEVIFTSAFEHYALKAIKFSALDYLLKPIDIDELQGAVNKVVNKKMEVNHNKKLEAILHNFRNGNLEKHTITLATSEGYEFISVADIIYCEGAGSYTTFFLAGENKILVSKHLKEYENLLKDYNFMRVHQSFLINLSQVKKYIKSEGGYISMNGGGVARISSKNREKFLSEMSKQQNGLQ